MRTSSVLLYAWCCLWLCGGATQVFPAARAASSEAVRRQAVPRAQDDSESRQEAELREAIRREPSNPAYPARLGLLLATHNKMGEAVAYFEKALKLDPKDLDTRASLAAGYWQLGQFGKARENLEMVLSAKPEDARATLLLGMVSEDLGDHRRAARLLGDVLPLARQRPEIISTLARSYYHLNETQKARDSLQMLVGHPAGPVAAFQGGQLAAEFKDYEEAESLFFAVQTTYPDRAAVNYYLALAQFSAKHYEQCEKTLQSSISDGYGTAEAYGLLGWNYEKQDKLPEMLKAFEKAINLEPANQTYFIDLGDALAEKKSYGTAMEVATEALKRFPSSSRAYGLKGSVELKMYLLTGALDSYSKAVELGPNNPRAALGRALTLWNMDRNVEAAKSFEEGVRKFPKDAFFLLKYALFLLNAPGERDTEADARIKELLTKSAELDGSLAETHFQLGNLAIKENNYETALAEMQEAARLDPDLPKVHYALARTYRRLGREADAAKESEIHRKLKEKEDDKATENAAIGTRHP